MLRLCLLAAVFALAVFAANVKLYLKDGGYQMVREYQVQGDRVRFYSVERSGWEEIPLELVDLDRTRKEADTRAAAMEAEQKVLAAEEKAERAEQAEAARIPYNPGVYWVDSGKTNTLEAAESYVRNAKAPSILNRITRKPIIEEKATIEIKGVTAKTALSPTQEFYIRLSGQERFAIAKLTPKTKDSLRVASNVAINQWDKTPDEAINEIPTLNRQIQENLYKFWPKEKLEPGEYAVVEYTKGEMNMQIWDFAVR